MALAYPTPAAYNFDKRQGFVSSIFSELNSIAETTANGDGGSGGTTAAAGTTTANDGSGGTTVVS